MYQGIAGRAAVVTGGANGIGEAIAKSLASEGCSVALWDLSDESLARTAGELRERGAKVATRVVNVGDLAAVRAAAESATAALGAAPTILVNSAGIRRIGSILDGSPEDFELTMRVNVHGAFNCCHTLVPGMVAQKRGSIVNISSWLGKSARPAALAYCASKFALIGMTQSMALDLAKQGIRVNAVCPGTIDETEMRRQSDVDNMAKGLPPASERVHLIPLGRLGTTEDIANVATFLISDAASYMTGQSINVTGGLWMN